MEINTSLFIQNNRSGFPARNSRVNDEGFSSPSSQDSYTPSTPPTNDRYNPHFVRSELLQDSGMLQILLAALENARYQGNEELMQKILKKIQGFGLL